MKRNAMRKNLIQSILKSFGRYIAIVMIIALGSSMFVGLLMTKSDMVATGQKFMDEQNMFDLRFVNAFGWSAEDVDAISQIEGLVDVEGIQYTDLIVHLNDSEDDKVYRVYAMPEKINLFSLRGGRMPEKENECLIDGYHMDDDILGTVITVSDANKDDAKESVKCTSFTVVGYIASPLYMDMNRGSTSVGSGSLANYIYVPADSLDLDYYAEINATIPGTYKVYSDEYNDALDAWAEELKPLLQPYADDRLLEVKKEAIHQYAEGLHELEDGMHQFEEGKQEALQQLADAEAELLQAEQDIADNEQKLIDGEQQLASAMGQLSAAQKELDDGKAQLEQMKSLAYTGLDTTKAGLEGSIASQEAQLVEKQSQIDVLQQQIDEISASIAQTEAELNKIDGEINRINASIGTVDAGIAAAQATINFMNLMPIPNTAMIAQLEGQIAQLQTQKAQYQLELVDLENKRGEVAAIIEEPLSQRAVIEEQRDALERERTILSNSIQTMKTTIAGIESSKQALDEEFAKTEAEILAGQQQISDGWAQVYSSQWQLEDGKRQLEEGKQKVADGWIEYEEGKLEAEQELAEAEAELMDAKQQLADARELIHKMKDNPVMVLGRNSNVGYNSLESASDIVQGVSRVFPAFFLLVAAMVCITTMTRMIDEERTQIGTLKALGYSNSAIISKYLLYAGSGAIIGCGLGVFVGSAAFPVILWQAYKIMLYITDDIVLQINWWLCGAVVGTYTLVMLMVTWYCCRRTLREVPAELIRPKAPDPGKKLFMEQLPFWHKISFLNKVTIRNIFRYRQRLAMMLLGIGGCTALLLTGFGLRDSIVNVVDYQFREVTTYDMSVYFREGQDEDAQRLFKQEIAYGAENSTFYHQSSMEIEHENMTKEIYLVAGDDSITDFIDLHVGQTKISMPGMNEVVLSVGVAEAMGIEVGDEISLRNADMKRLNLTVSGIYDNHVENYAIIIPDTITHQYGEAPQMQMAFVTVKEDMDVHEMSADITRDPNVLNVSVSEDLAQMVGSMMDALDLVVWVVVVCAGLLAVIVLYNLTNININERIREIATIKVLGFNARETAMYVFKENLSLSVVGSALGLGLGYLLLLFVMSQIKIDMVWFKALAMPISYVISIVLTLLAAVIVDFVFYFKLDKINMAEALKSVE